MEQKQEPGSLPGGTSPSPHKALLPGIPPRHPVLSFALPQTLLRRKGGQGLSEII